MPNPVTHFEIISKDAAKAQKFYADLFGWTVNADNPIQYGIVEGTEGGIGGGIAGSPDGQQLLTFYVQVDDLQAYLDKAQKMGGKVVMPVTEIPGMVTFAQFADPDGHVIGLVKSQ